MSLQDNADSAPVTTVLPAAPRGKSLDARYKRRVQNLPKPGPTFPPFFTPTCDSKPSRNHLPMATGIFGGNFSTIERYVYFIMKQEQGFAWDDSERGSFRHDFFPPVEFPLVEHETWVEKSIPIPRGQLEEFCRVIKKKIDAGVYEPSNASYRSKFFGVVKKDGKSIRLVHS